MALFHALLEKIRNVAEDIVVGQPLHIIAAPAARESFRLLRQHVPALERSLIIPGFALVMVMGVVIAKIFYSGIFILTAKSVGGCAWPPAFIGAPGRAH
jgi:hypothetical protein